MDEADTYTIAEFCVRNRICRAHYYKLRPLRLPPAEMRLGSKVLISKEAAAVWRRKMETANSKPPAADAAACFNETEQLEGACRRAHQPPVRQNVWGTPKHPERKASTDEHCWRRFRSVAAFTSHGPSTAAAASAQLALKSRVETPRQLAQRVGITDGQIYVIGAN